MTDDEDAAGMRAPLLQPPRLRTEGERNRPTRLELFFDLAYVLVVAELAAGFGHDLTWHGLAVFAGLFTVTWWSWVTTTLYANRFDTNDVIYRVAKLGQTFAIVVMAAAAEHAVGEDAAAFGLGYIATRLVLLALYARAYRHVPRARTTLLLYSAGAAAGAICWSVALVVPGPGRYGLWAAGVVVEAAAPLLATRWGGDVPLHEEHLPERFGLFTILVLGEAVASVMFGLRGTDWQLSSVAVAALGFVIAAALWWSYFDVGGARGREELTEDDSNEPDGRHDRYVFGHLPVLIGLAAAGVGIEEFVLHPSDFSAGATWALCGGASLFLLGVALIMVGTANSWRAAWPWPWLAVPVPLLAVLLPTPLLSVAAVAVVLLATLAEGLREKHTGNLQPTSL